MSTFWGVTAPGVQKPGGPKWFAFHVSNVAATFKKLTASFSAFMGFIGAEAGTLKQLTASLSGFVPETGTLAAQGKKMAAAFVATQTQQGTIASTGKQLTASLAAQDIFSGSIASVMKPMNSNFVATMGEAGTMASTLKQLQASVNGVEIPSGNIVSSFMELSAALQGVEIPSGAIASILHQMSAILNGAQEYDGTLGGVHKQLTAALAGSQSFPASGTIAGALKKAAAALAGTIGAPVVVFDSVGGGWITASASSTPNWSHTTVAAGTYILLILANTTNSFTISGITWGGSTPTLLGSQAFNNAGTNGVLYFYEFVGASSGAHTIATTWTGSVSACCNSIAYTGRTSTAALTKSFNSGTALSQAVTNTGVMLVQAFAGRGSSAAITSPTGGTSRFNNHGGVSTAQVPLCIIESSLPSTTFGATMSPAGAWAGANAQLS
jgi:hypothetical protein